MTEFKYFMFIFELLRLIEVAASLPTSSSELEHTIELKSPVVPTVQNYKPKPI